MRLLKAKCLRQPNTIASSVRVFQGELALAPLKAFLKEYKIAKRNMPVAAREASIYTGVTTGFCGCLTTFSSWNHAAAEQ